MPNGIQDVVVLIPGISGSVLERDGKEAGNPGFTTRVSIAAGWRSDPVTPYRALAGAPAGQSLPGRAAW